MADDHWGSSPRVDLTKRQGATPPPVVPPSRPLTPPPPAAPTHQTAPPAAPVSGRSGGRQVASSGPGSKKLGLIVAAVVVGVLVVGGGAIILGNGSEPDEREAAASPATQDEQSAAADPVSTEYADDPTEAPPTSSTTPTADLSGNPIVDGWFVLVSSALKGSAEVDALPGVASGNGGQVVDTDSYQTGFASDGRGGTLDEQAAVAPDYWPGANAVAAVIGPFPDRSAAEEQCRQRDAPLGSCVRQFRPITTPSS